MPQQVQQFLAFSTILSQGIRFTANFTYQAQGNTRQPNITQQMKLLVILVYRA